MRIIHVVVAIGIALLANEIEPAWLGFIALTVMLGAYTYLVISLQKRK